MKDTFIPILITIVIITIILLVLYYCFGIILTTTKACILGAVVGFTIALISSLIKHKKHD